MPDPDPQISRLLRRAADEVSTDVACQLDVLKRSIRRGCSKEPCSMVPPRSTDRPGRRGASRTLHAQTGSVWLIAREEPPDVD